MSSSELTPLSHAVLVLIGRGGAGAHDLVRMARQGRVYGGYAESRYYAEPKRLAKLGYLTARAEPGKTHERTHYELTDKAFDALRCWMEEPAEAPRVRGDAITRMLAADLIGEAPVRKSLLAMRDDIRDLYARLDVAEAVAETLPHRRKYLLLNHQLARAVLRAHEEWLDAVEQQLSSRK